MQTQRSKRNNNKRGGENQTEMPTVAAEEGEGENGEANSEKGEEEKEEEDEEEEDDVESEQRKTLTHKTVKYLRKNALRAKKAAEAELESMSRTVLVREDFSRKYVEVLSAMKEHADGFLQMDLPRQIVYSIIAGMFISSGAFLSVVLSAGVEWSGFGKLLLGLGFAAGFSLVVMSGAALFTEINLLVPVRFLKIRKMCLQCLRLWTVAFFGNLAGALLMGAMYEGSLALQPTVVVNHLREILASKLVVQEYGAEGWFRTVLSGLIANVLVAMAAFYGTSARTVPGKLLGIAVPIVMFSSLGVQHSPANMGYFGLALARGGQMFEGLEATTVDRGTIVFDSSFGQALAFNVLPSAVGNILGGFLIATLLTFMYAGKAEPASPSPSDKDDL